MKSSSESSFDSSSEEIAELDVGETPDTMEPSTQAFADRVEQLWVPAEAARVAPQATPRKIGRYRLDRILGRGGFGIVYLAHDSFLQRVVALKVPILGPMEDARNRERFLTESRAAASLQHRYILPVYDAGEVDGISYLAMRFCPLGTLAAWLMEQQTPLDPRAAAALTQVLCEAVGHAHELNIVHRDLKPANILLELAPSDSSLQEFGIPFVPLVSDFGMAKIFGWDDPLVQREHLTRTGTRMGTPCYMPPEHATGRAKESQTTADVYALGVILFELLVGQPPFTGESDYEVLHQVVSCEPPAIRNFRSDVPRSLESICRKCLEKSPERRYRDANELGQDLSRFLAGERIANLPWFDASLVRSALFQLLLCLVVFLLFVAAWVAPYWKEIPLFPWWQERKPEPVVNAPWRDYAIAIENALPAAIGAIDDGARRLLDDPGFLDQYGDKLGFEWRYARQGTQHDVSILRGTEGVHGVQFSPDGKFHAEHASDGHIWLGHESVPEKLLNITLSSDPQFPSDPHSAYPLKFSADSELVFSSDSKWFAASERTLVPNASGVLRGIEIWSLKNGIKRMWRTGLQSDVRRVAGMTFSKDGNWLYLHGCDDQNRAAIWKCHLESPQVSWKWTSEQGMVHALVESGAEDELWLCQTIEEDLEPKTSVLALKMSSRGTRELLPGFVGDPAFARFSPDASHLVMGEYVPHREDRILDLNLFDLSQGRMVYRLREPFGSLEAFTFERNTNNLYVVCTGSLEPNANRIIRKWDASEGSLNWVRALPPGLKVTAMTSLPSSDALVLCRTADPQFHIVELKRTAITEIHGHYPKETWALTFSLDGSRLLSGGDDGLVRVWDVANGHLLDEFNDHHPQLVTAAAYQWDSLRRVATGSFDRTVKIWNTEAPERSVVTLPHEAVVRNLAFVPGVRSVVTLADDLGIRSWSDATCELQWESRPSANKSRCVVAHPNGHEIAVAGNDGILRLLSPKDGAVIVEAASSSSQIWALVYSPSEETWIVGTEAGTIEWLERESAKLKLWNATDSGVLELAMSPDGKTLVSANAAGEVEMWQVGTNSFLGVLDRVNQPTHALAFSPDGQHLAAGLHDGSIRMWNAPNPDISP